MRKTIWIAREDNGPSSHYVIELIRPEKSLTYAGGWLGDLGVCAEMFEKFLAPADRLKPGEGPKRIKIKLGGG